jgi:thioesterase domain-containing protein/acyl carrier protein
VKIRGYRIELGEIEAVLESHADVNQALVVVTPVPDGTAQLSAYYTGNQLEPSQLQHFLRQKLPSYMEPVHYIWLEAMPLSLTGKVDRAALPQPGGEHIAVSVDVEPLSPMEAQIAALWCEHLRLDRVGKEDNFFGLGGYSLLATQMIYDLRTEHQVDIPISAMLDNPTIKEMANYIQNLCGGGCQPDERLIKLNRIDQGEPLFLIHPAGGGVNMYGALAQTITSPRPLIAIKAAGMGDHHEPDTCILAMAKRYSDDIQSYQPEGRIHLLGFSMGGQIALHMARMFEELGRQVAFLSLIDTAAPHLFTSTGTIPDKWEIFLNIADCQRHELPPEFETLATSQQVEHLYQMGLSKKRISPGFSQRDMIELAAMTIAHLEASQNVPDVSYSGRVHLFRAEEQPDELGNFADLGWGNQLPDLVVHNMSGHHRSPFREPHVQRLGEEISTLLENVSNNLRFSEVS